MNSSSVLSPNYYFGGSFKRLFYVAAKKNIVLVHKVNHPAYYIVFLIEIRIFCPKPTKINNTLMVSPSFLYRKAYTVGCLLQTILRFKHEYNPKIISQIKYLPYIQLYVGIIACAIRMRVVDQ